MFLAHPLTRRTRFDAHPCRLLAANRVKQMLPHSERTTRRALKPVTTRAVGCGARRGQRGTQPASAESQCGEPSWVTRRSASVSRAVLAASLGQLAKAPAAKARREACVAARRTRHKATTSLRRRRSGGRDVSSERPRPCRSRTWSLQLADANQAAKTQSRGRLIRRRPARSTGVRRDRNLHEENCGL